MTSHGAGTHCHGQPTGAVKSLPGTCKPAEPLEASWSQPLKLPTEAPLSQWEQWKHPKLHQRLHPKPRLTSILNDEKRERTGAHHWTVHAGTYCPASHHNPSIPQSTPTRPLTRQSCISTVRGLPLPRRKLQKQQPTHQANRYGPGLRPYSPTQRATGCRSVASRRPGYPLFPPQHGHQEPVLPQRHFAASPARQKVLASLFALLLRHRQRSRRPLHPQQTQLLE